MRKILSLLSGLMLLAAASSCIYDFKPEVESAAGNIVVDGDILAGDISIIRVSESVALDSIVSSDAARTLAGTGYWSAWVELDNGERIDGTPYGNDAFRIDTRPLTAGDKCRLCINHIKGYNKLGEIESHCYASAWLTVQSTSPIDSISSVIAEDGNTMDFCVTSSGGGSTPYFRWFGREDWEYTADLFAHEYYYLPANEIREYQDGDNSYYCWKNAEVPEIMIANTSGLKESRFENHRIYTYDNHNEKISYLYSVLVVQENLTEEAYRYWSAMERNSTDVGGLFSSQPSDVRGNIYNVNDSTEVVIGFINASEVSTMRYFFDSSKHLFYRRLERFTDEPKAVNRKDWKYYYSSMNYRPFSIHEEELPNGEVSSDPDVYDWYPRRCIECTAKGGSKVKPDYWPNNHK